MPTHKNMVQPAAMGNWFAQKYSKRQLGEMLAEQINENKRLMAELEERINKEQE